MLECMDGPLMGATKFKEMKSYYVLQEARQSCVCVYEVRWNHLVAKLAAYRRRMRKRGLSSSSFEVISNPQDKRSTKTPIYSGIYQHCGKVEE